jgi:flagellar basal-body rod protein FlgB
MKTKLETLSERQTLLAQNIANADTPGYKAKDVVEPDFKKMVTDASKNSAQKLPMAITNPSHISAHPSAATLKVVNTRTTNELSPNGNNVVIEEEMSKIAANQAEYQKVLNLYSKAVSMFRTAIGNPNTGA